MVAKDKAVRRQQRGGFGLGVIVGLLVGLALALAVALYVTKAPVPFVEKVPSRTQEQDAAEADRNKNWDPNSPLYGKNPAKPHPVEAAPVASGVVTGSTANAPAPAVTPPAAVNDPAASAAGVEPAAKPVKPAASAASAAAVDPNARYLVQVGAYTSREDAEQQRAKLAMNGLTAKISERERDGMIFYRVRLGAFPADQAERVKDQVADLGFRGAALIRVTGQ